MLTNSNSNSNSTLGPPAHTNTNNHLAIADTGSTANFGTIDAPVLNKRPTLNPITIHNPNGSVMMSTHEAELDLPMLPPAARHIHIVPDLASSSLLSIGQLCDAGCYVAFNATTVTVSHNDTIVLTGHRTPATRLWHLTLPTPLPAPAPSPTPAPASAHAAIGSATPAELVAFAHAALFSPALSTLKRALDKGFLTNFPGLTPTLLRKHPPRSVAMVKGHLDQARQNQRSTRPSHTTSRPTTDDTSDNTSPPSPIPNERSHFC